MKKFEFPEICVLTFQVEDIMTGSNELPIQPFSLLEDEFDIQPLK